MTDKVSIYAYCGSLEEKCEAPFFVYALSLEWGYKSKLDKIYPE
jgi:hypothetical protein